MRRYLWIVVSCVLPLAFLYVMSARPPRSPGTEVRGSSEALGAEQQGALPVVPAEQASPTGSTGGGAAQDAGVVDDSGKAQP